jgi:hypothetical protein
MRGFQAAKPLILDSVIVRIIPVEEKVLTDHLSRVGRCFCKTNFQICAC